MGEGITLQLALPVVLICIMLCNSTTTQTVETMELKHFAINCFGGGIDFDIELIFAIVVMVQTMKHHCFYLIVFTYVLESYNNVTPQSNPVSLHSSCNGFLNYGMTSVCFK